MLSLRGFRINCEFEGDIISWRSLSRKATLQNNDKTKSYIC